MVPTPDHTEAASTLAVIALSNEPLLFLARDLTLIAASASFCRAFQINPGTIPEHQLSELGEGEWTTPQLVSLLKATASGSAKIDAYEFDLVRPGQPTRNLVLNARRLEDGDPDNIRLLLAVTDVTVARAAERHKDQLVSEKAVLLREVQHRVANSLQIIASVILQSARKAHTEETRGYLKDAHNRVMSVAALQRQLASSQLGEVGLRDYFTQLCASIGASMIRDHSQLTLALEVDDSFINADTSISLGLVVTELVINSLKHAFPEGRKGRIVVSYRADGPAWTLSVSDDGVGMPQDVANKPPGLGTSIVNALAHQLKATVRLTAGHPGTVVEVIRGADADQVMPQIKAV